MSPTETIEWLNSLEFIIEPGVALRLKILRKLHKNTKMQLVSKLTNADTKNLLRKYDSYEDG